MNGSLSKVLASILPYVVMIILGVFLIKGYEKDEDTDIPKDTTDTIITYRIERDLNILFNIEGPDKVIQPRAEQIVRYMEPDSVDTNYIIMDYLSKKYFNSVLVDDSLLYFAIRDTLFMNDIYSREFDYVLRSKLKTIDNTIYMHKEQRAKLLVGGGLINHPLNTDISIGLAYMTKNEKLLFTGNVGLLGRGIMVNVYYKIKLKKNAYTRYGSSVIRDR